MILNIRDSPPPAHEGEEQAVSFSQSLDLSGIRRFGENPFPRPVQIEGALRRQHGEVTAEYTARYELTASCARCLEQVTEKGELYFSHIITELLDDGAPERIPAPGGMLDLEELVGSDLLLSLGCAQLCSPGCKGLCPHCGGNRNQTECGCDLLHKQADPRFSALLDLL